MIRLARPVLGGEEVEMLRQVLESGWLVQGKHVRRFEELLEARLPVAHTVACSSGTAALQLALAALNLPAGSRVAIPAYTFPAPINAVLLAGLEPVLVDVDPSTYNLDPREVTALLNSSQPPALLIAIHQFGLPAPLGDLLDTASEAGMHIIEDAACALGSALRVDGHRVPAGTIGVMGCFSFHPRKIITTAEGGAVSTEDGDLAERLRLLRNHGQVRDQQTGRSEFKMPGWNLRLSDLHGALGEIQMGRLDGILSDRKRIAEGYIQRLSTLTARGLELPRVPADAEPNWQSFVVRLPPGSDVTGVIGALRERSIESTVGAQALHREAAYRDLPGCAKPLPGTDDCITRALALPTPPAMSDAQMDEVAAAMAEILA